MNFIDYTDKHFNDCMTLFDQNCPTYFAPNERDDYIEYLQSTDDQYKLAYDDGKLAAAFGTGVNDQNDHAYITWIMVSPEAHGKGIGAKMMETAISFANSKNTPAIDIAASHLSAPFFAKFGAISVKITEHGWGQNMHRVDMALYLTK